MAYVHLAKSDKGMNRFESEYARLRMAAVHCTNIMRLLRAYAAGAVV